MDERGGLEDLYRAGQVEHRVASAGMGVIVVMPLRVGRVEGVEVSNALSRLPPSLETRPDARPRGIWSGTAAFDGVVGVECHETIHRVGDAGLDQAKSDETVIPRGYPQGFTNTRTADLQA